MVQVTINIHLAQLLNCIKKISSKNDIVMGLVSLF